MFLGNGAVEEANVSKIVRIWQSTSAFSCHGGSRSGTIPITAPAPITANHNSDNHSNNYSSGEVETIYR